MERAWLRWWGEPGGFWRAQWIGSGPPASLCSRSPFRQMWGNVTLHFQAFIPAHMLPHNIYLQLFQILKHRSGMPMDGEPTSDWNLWVELEGDSASWSLDHSPATSSLTAVQQDEHETHMVKPTHPKLKCHCINTSLHHQFCTGWEHIICRRHKELSKTGELLAMRFITYLQIS